MLQAVLSILALNGFIEHDQSQHFFSTPDIKAAAGAGLKMRGFHYLHRVYQTRSQYAHVVSYEGELCEMVYETFVAVKQTKVPKHMKTDDLITKGCHAQAWGILRDPDEIAAWCAADVPVWPRPKVDQIKS